MFFNSTSWAGSRIRLDADLPVLGPCGVSAVQFTLNPKRQTGLEVVLFIVGVVAGPATSRCCEAMALEVQTYRRQSSHACHALLLLSPDPKA